MKLKEIEIEVRYKNSKIEVRSLRESGEVANFMRELFNQGTIIWREEVILLCLNRQNAPIGYFKLSAGGTAGTVIDPKIIYTVALKAAASCIILAHNHPSGTTNPSEADMRLTKIIAEGGRLLECPLIDHLIITDTDYFSFCDEGLL